MADTAIIDTHQHVIPDVYRSELARLGVMGSGENPWPPWSLPRALELMDRHGIAAVMTSIASPGTYFGDVDVTRRLVRACNEALADIVSQQPDRLGALGFVPLPPLWLAAMLGLVAVYVCTAEIAKHAFFAKLSRRSV